MCISVFEIVQVVEGKKARILGKHEPNDLASKKNYGIIRGEAGYSVEDWIPWDDIFVAAPNPPSNQVGLRPDPTSKLAREWDYFGFSSSSGVFSQRAIDVLMPYLERCYIPLPSTVDGEPFYFLHIKETVDALNEEESEIEYSETMSETIIIWIERYKFYKDRLDDPLIFSLPQFRPFLFATESIPRIVEEAGLKGFKFNLLDSE